MNKLQMAHEYALKMLENLNPMQMEKPTRDGIVYECFELADAMQAEADKREKEEAAQKRKEIREILNAPNTFVEREGQHFDDVEWQPDWSQAPDWANWWCLSVMHGAMWFSREPICTKSTWAMLNDVKFCAASFDEAPSFNYQGNWQYSLRKRQ